MKAIVFVLIFFLMGCASQSQGGLGKPSIFSSPVSYMETIGLGVYTREDVMRVLGNPHNVTDMGDKEYWGYFMGQDYGERTYTYIFQGDLLVNVRYNDNGPYNGLTARKSQNK